jgi:anaphase-promoting complex subunit 3
VHWVRDFNLLTYPSPARIHLLTLGTAPENIDEILPPHDVPVPPTTFEDGTSAAVPIATGAGFFTPGTVGVPALFRGVKQDLRMQSFRMEPPTGSM